MELFTGTSTARTSNLSSTCDCEYANSIKSPKNFFSKKTLIHLSPYQTIKLDDIRLITKVKKIRHGIEILQK